MELLSPAALLWLGLAVPLVLLYVLKRRRRERLVSSTLLWQQALHDLRAERPFRRLIPHVSLLLQLLILLLGALALARPSWIAEGVQSDRLAIVVDASASMGATQGGESRVDRARTIAAGLVGELASDGELMIILAGRDPEVVAPLSADPAVHRRGLEALRVTGDEADLATATDLAVERVSSASGERRVVVLTDRASDGELVVGGRTVDVEVREVGQGAANTGIVAVDVRSQGNPDARDRVDIFVRVAHYGSPSVEPYVVATARYPGRRDLVASRRIRVTDGEQASVLIGADLPPDDAGQSAVIEVTLQRSDPEAGAGMEDALAVDDVAYAFSPGSRRLAVYFVGTPPVSVRRVFLADEDVEVFQTSLPVLAEAPEVRDAMDGLQVFTGETPESAPPGESLVLSPRGSRVFGARLEESRRAPAIVRWDDDDPLLRFVQLTDLHLAEARAVQGGAPLVIAQNGPVIARLSRPDGQSTVVGFDPDRTDWPDQPSFVVFFRNLLEAAREAQGGRAGDGSSHLGEAARVPANDGERVVADGRGATVEAVGRAGVAFIPLPASPGAYRVSGGSGPRWILRSLLDEGESNLMPRLSVVEQSGGEPVEVQRAEERVELWRPLLWLLLPLLVIEVSWATRGRRWALRAARGAAR